MKLSILLQYLLPKQAITALAGKLANLQCGTTTTKVIAWFVQRYQVNMAEAANPNISSYATFNDFFTRPLKANARPIAKADFICPVDGAISQFGHIEQDQIFQAKNHNYSSLTLLAGNQALANKFQNGGFACLYLSPKDYHRIHMPCDGTLKSMAYVPGDLFSVNPNSLYCITLAADNISFDAKAAGQQVKLQWKTGNEQQLKQYRIEHLATNGSWMALGNIAAAGSGHTYHFTDLHPEKGINQYRLALLNQDGSYHLSEIRKVNIAAATGDMEIISNPASSLNLVVYGDVKNITVFDAAGQQLFDHPVKQNTSGSTTVSLNQFTLYTGFYFVKALFGNGEVKTLKFVKQ